MWETFLLKKDKMNSNPTIWEYLSVKLLGPDCKYYEYFEFVEIIQVYGSQSC